MNMETKVLSDDPENIPGELVCRGYNVMMGYYKNEEATAQTIDRDGWLHTGDMAIKDAEGNVFIKGRCKNMLLTASGQNIYPEEIEARLNNMPFVNESLVLLSDNKLIALVYPDNEEAFTQGLSKKQLEDALESNRIELNKQLPAYAQITRFTLYPEDSQEEHKALSLSRYRRSERQRLNFAEIHIKTAARFLLRPCGCFYTISPLRFLRDQNVRP